MENSIQFKFEFENTLRRLTVPKLEYDALKNSIAGLLGFKEFEIQYRDEDGDIITVGSNAELQDAVQTAIKTGRLLKFVVTRHAQQQAPQKEEEATKPQQAPQIPFAEVAKALANPEVVLKIQNVFGNPILTETITKAAQLYLETQGDFLSAWTVISDQIPVILALFAEVLDEFPELKEVFQTLQSLSPFAGAAAFGLPEIFLRGGLPQQCAASFFRPAFASFDPFAEFQRAACAGAADAPQHPFAGHCHRRFAESEAPQHPFAGHCHRRSAESEAPQQHPFKNVHFGVSCDGCSTFPELKEISRKTGHYTEHRGFIQGNRYKSDTVHDFDLCESCKESGKFTEQAYGPFQEIKPEDQRRGCRGGWWAAGRGGCHNKRAHMASPGIPASEEPEKKKDVAQEAAQEKPRVSSTEEQEWVPVVATVPSTKWDEQLQLLASLGFVDTETNVKLLETESGDLTRVVNRLIRLQ